MFFVSWPYFYWYINGNINKTPENGGSYDYEKPSILNGFNNHLKVDVEPWIKLGNTPQDKTTKEQRVEAMGMSKTGKQGLRQLGYRYDRKNKTWVK